MAITVNVISENNAFNVENANYATVALPITACWGPGFVLPTSSVVDSSSGESGEDSELDTALENTAWSLFNATPEGLESFIATYRGPSSNYRSTKDYSYFMALSLLNAGYAVQTCRLCPGTYASTYLPQSSSSGSGSGNSVDSDDINNVLVITAKYPGSFGNNLKVSLTQKTTGDFKYWNLVGYTIDANKQQRAVENLVFVFDPAKSTDTIVSIDELQSKFFTFKVVGTINESAMATSSAVRLEGGSDVAASEGQSATDIMTDAFALATKRYGGDSGAYYLQTLQAIGVSIGENKSLAETIRFNEWIYTYAVGEPIENYNLDADAIKGVYDLLKDKINYNPNRVISPWDDQDILTLNPDADTTLVDMMGVSPIHQKLLNVADMGRCATAYIDIPRSLSRSKVSDSTLDNEVPVGYAQKLATFGPATDNPLYPSNAALFTPWGQYVYTGTSRQAPATPSFIALLLERAMIKNQAAQYEWALPNTRNNNVKLGQLAYTVPKKLMDIWQAPDGVRVNVITTVPSLGTTVWGNATLFDVPVATYNALQNLSTRKLVNAVKDTVFKIGIGLEFQYNNQEAYAKFYAGVTPLLDTMKNVGAIEDYKVKMAADINNVDSINANSVIGTIYLVIAGVIENITVDLIALPQGTDLSQF